MERLENEHCPMIKEINADLERMGLGALLSETPLGSLTCFSFLEVKLKLSAECCMVNTEVVQFAMCNGNGY